MVTVSVASVRREIASLVTIDKRMYHGVVSLDIGSWLQTCYRETAVGDKDNLGGCTSYLASSWVAFPSHHSVKPEYRWPRHQPIGQLRLTPPSA